MMETTVVGSYPVPTWLQAHSTREGLRDAMLAVIKTQEIAGIDVVADGELYRWDVNHAETNGMIDYFIRPLQGIRTALSFTELDEWRRDQAMNFRAKPAGAIQSALSHGTLDLKADYELFAGMSMNRKKFTITSPYMLARTLADNFYPDLEARVQALAKLLGEQASRVAADVIQIDEAHVTGHPEHAEIAADGINTVLKHVEVETGVHLCFGNYGGQSIQQGDYHRLIEFLNRLECDHVILEIAARPQEELAYLRDVRSELLIGIGVIDVKDNRVESVDTVASRIEAAANCLGQERIRYVHPDCGFWMLPRSVADQKMRNLVAGRDRFEGAPPFCLDGP